MKYKAVIFDLYGTLVDNFTDSEYEKVLEQMAEQLGVPGGEFSRRWRESFPMRIDGTHQTEADSIRYICDLMGVSVTDDRVRKALEIRTAYEEKTLIPRPATIPTINELKRRGYRIGLISDCSPETPEAWPETQFTDLFQATVFSCLVRMKKPDPRIYLITCEQLGVKPDECLYIGDGSSHELTGAAGVGMHPVLLRDPDENDDTHFIDRETDWTGPVISRLDEVLEMVD